MAKIESCPKCGRQGSLQKKWSKGRWNRKRYYYLAVEHSEGGKVRWCYVGRRLPE